MTDEDLLWWTQAQRPCPSCGSTGVPIVMDAQDAPTMEAVRTGLAVLAGCGLGGAADGNDRQCLKCAHEWAA